MPTTSRAEADGRPREANFRGLAPSSCPPAGVPVWGAASVISTWRVLGVVVAFVLLALARSAHAHAPVTAEVDVELLSANDARIATRGGVAIVAPAGCVLSQALLHCDDAIAGKEIATTGADAFVRVGDETTVVTKRARAFVVPGAGSSRAVIGRFVRLGIEHVLTGLDHVLFLLALFWQARGKPKELLKTATAFTIAHSLTLGATMLGALHVRPAVAEACIALSLVLVALDLRQGVGLVGAFGLVHGLGFAGAMADTRLPEAGKWTALLAFNGGIELGQIAVFAACLALTRVVRWRHTELVTAYGVGISGAAMFFLRALAVIGVAFGFLVLATRPALAQAATPGPATPPATTASPATGPTQPENPDDFRGLARQNKPKQPDVIAPNGAQPGPQSSTPAPTPRTWELIPFGYVRAGVDYTTKDSRYTFIGRNNGFVLDSARVGLDGHSAEPWHLSFRISIEGASDELSNPNTPIGRLSVRLRDAFARWDPYPFIGIQVGQFKAPWQEEELRGTNTLLFASRAVGVEGVLPGRGFQTPGLVLDRQVGAMISNAQPIGGRAVAASYYLMIMNGNGANQVLDDNGKFGFVGRTELGIYEYVRLGAGVFHNERTVGEPPNLYTETDTGLTGDLSLKVGGLQALAAVTNVRTVFPTVGASARVQLAYHAQAGYKFELENWHIGPAYRFAHFHPWQTGGADGFDAYAVQYHTFGIRAGLTKIPLQAWLNYTMTGEGEGRKLDNDRIELLGQVTF